MRSYWKIKLWAKFVNHFDVFDNLWGRKIRNVTAALIGYFPGSFFLYWTGQSFLASSAYTFCVSCGCHIMKLLITDCLVNAEKFSDLSSNIFQH